DVPHPGADLLERRLPQVRLAQDLGLDLLAERAVRRLDALDVVRAIAGAAVRDDGGHLRHLQGRRGHVSLADRDRERLAGEPRLVEAAALPLRIGDRARLLVFEADAGREAEAQAARVLGDAVDAETLARLVEEGLRRIDGRA